MQPLDHAPLDHDHALLLVLGMTEGVDHLARPVDLLLRRREDLVAGPDLARMDQSLAVHAEGAAALAFVTQALLVAEVVIDAVDDVEAIGARGDEGHGEPGHHGEAVMQRAGARFLDQVVGAHDEAAEPVLGIDGGGGDGAGIEDRHRRLHHGPEADLLRRMHALQDLGDADDVAGMHDLRHEDGVRLGIAGGENVLGAPGRLQRIDADDHLARAVAAAFHRGADLGTRLQLLVRRHGVLEVEDERVGGKGLGLLQRALVGARHIEHAPARAALHDDRSPLVQCSVDPRLEPDNPFQVRGFSSRRACSAGISRRRPQAPPRCRRRRQGRCQRGGKARRFAPTMPFLGSNQGLKP